MSVATASVVYFLYSIYALTPGTDTGTGTDTGSNTVTGTDTTATGTGTADVKIEPNLEKETKDIV